ncbi:(Lyso)-N-acylphosphatidylethanolamine lipase isoform X1 [Periplaneta americana]|uniref:(Lyso)-N-acylphosphatidylethanolamine lipase isoform X1 n=2 Tax=Periplaneta americana TaxID=6978 RepID=UPI0037E824CF
MTLVQMADNELAQNNSSWFRGWLQWSPTSSTMLRAAEKKILSCLKSAYRGWYVDIGPVVGPADKIWTISLNQESSKTPILLLHGLGAGVALWCLNLDHLAATRPVYAIDVLGFGRSSRPTFSSDALVAERQLVTSVEEWRREMQLEKMIVLGHSLGGFLAASYAIHYPDRVKHLVLADPWGFPEKPADVAQRYNVPLWVRAIAYVIQPFNPLWPVRAAGPFGQWVIEKTRPDIIKKFSSFLNEDANVIPQYIFQCNAQNPTGEAAFHAMMASFGWAKHPMINRIDALRNDIPITLLYGSRSWVDNASGELIREQRRSSYVNIQVITGAGHHVYADKAETFNRHVIEACKLADSGELSKTSVIQANPTSELEEETSQESIPAQQNPSS